jgi:hypothetical protein
VSGTREPEKKDKKIKKRKLAFGYYEQRRAVRVFIPQVTLLVHKEEFINTSSHPAPAERDAGARESISR